MLSSFVSRIAAIHLHKHIVLAFGGVDNIINSLIRLVQYPCIVHFFWFLVNAFVITAVATAFIVDNVGY